jgi:hypothetical protein
MHPLFFVFLTFFLSFPVLLFSGEIVHLKFDGSLNDSAGGRQGKSIGTPVGYTTDRFGNLDRAVLLKKGSRISLGNDKALSFDKDGKTHPFTVEWFQRYDVNGSGVNVEVLNKEGEYRIAWNNAFRLRTDDHTNGGSLSRNGHIYLKYGEWTHIAVVFENTGIYGIRFYQDGKPACSPVIKDAGEQGKYLSMTPSRASLVVGAGFEGALDDFVIHDRALSIEEIRQRVLPQVTAAPGTPVLDGKLSDACWKKAEPITRFFPADNAVSVKEANTTAYLTYDDEALYAAFRCGLPAGAEAGTEGCVEVFLSPVPDQGFAYRFAVCADGRIRASRTNASDMVSGATAAVGRDGDFWNVELKIPYQDLNLQPGVGKLWGVNLVRNNKLTGRTYIWSSASIDPDAPDRFGMMICSRPADLHPFLKRTVLRRLEPIKQKISGLPAQDAKKLMAETSELEKLQDMDVLDSKLNALERKVQLLLGKNAILKSGRIEIRIGHSLQKISSDLKPFGNVPKRQVEISAARKEAESFQLIVSSTDGKPLEDVSVSGLELKNGNSFLNLSWRRVGYVKTLETAIGYPDAPPGFWADPLLPPGKFSIGAKSRQPLWFTIQVPENAVPGVYRGQVKIAAGNDKAEVPVTVRVRPFVVPRTLATAFGNYSSASTRYYKQKMPFDKFIAFCHLMNEYRLGSKSAVSENIPRKGGSINFSRVRKLLPEVYPYNAAIHRLPTIGRKLEDPERYQKILDDYRKITTAWKKENLPETMFLYGFDEPGIGGKEGFSSRSKMLLLPQLYRELKKIAPYPVLQTAGSVYLDLFIGSVDIWCPVLTAYSQKADFFQKRLAKNETLWLYTCNGDFPPIPNFYIQRPGIEHRIMFWQAYRAGATGFLYWTVNWWSILQPNWQENPVVKSDKDTGRSHGDGVLFYPGPDFEIWPSIRAAMIRDGIEDYEYLVLLKKLAAELKRKKNGKYGDLITRAEALCNINGITTHIGRYTRSPEKLFSHREKVGDMIEEIMKALSR